MPSRTPTPEAPAAAPPPAPEHGFFAWLRSLDLPRRPGWIGGVCAGVAARIGVDPVLVRGVVVVIAVLGGPVALLYALAWFLLPDEHGTIHARELGHGRVSRAIPGIVGIFLLSFLPLAQGFWFSGAFYWSDLGVGGDVLRAVWTGALVAVAVVAVVWLARRASTSSDVTTVPATTDDRPETVPSAPAASVDVDAPAEALAASAPGEPSPPPADASAEELGEWRRGQDAWQRQRAEWVAEQRRTEREQRAADARARSDAALAAARERARIDRITRPRAHAGVVALVLGVALVAAAIAAAGAQAQPSTRGAEWVIGAAVLVLVLGVGIVVVGLARRRSSGLTSLSITAVFLLIVSVGLLAVPIDREILPFTGYYGLARDHDGRYLRLTGSTELRVLDRPEDDEAPVVDLWQLGDGVNVSVEEGASVRIEVESDSWTQVTVMQTTVPDGGSTAFYDVGEGRRTFTVGSGAVDVVFRVHLSGNAYLQVYSESTTGIPLSLDPEPDNVESWGEPVPTPTPTEGVTP